MENKDIISLLDKYSLGTCSPKEKAAVESWYNSYAAKYAGKESVEELELEMQMIWQNIQKDKRQPKIVRFNYKKWQLAAAVATIIFGAALFYFNSRTGSEETPREIVSATDIAPGKMGATLTLANGKKIRLTAASNGEIAEEAGVSISKSAQGHLVYEINKPVAETRQTNTLSTSNGETYQLKLPDGTLVWLNAASSLTYVATLVESGSRKVKLSGEAYFQVARDTEHPFMVQTGAQEVEVLGTHFNINAYADEQAIATTLLEGSVKVTSGSEKYMLRPGEQAQNKRGKISVSNANIDNVMDWKNGEFYMNHINFKTAMRKIARWYDVEVIYNSSVPDEMQIGGWVSRNESLLSVLKSIESAGIVHFKIDGRKIYVSKEDESPR